MGECTYIQPATMQFNSGYLKCTAEGMGYPSANCWTQAYVGATSAGPDSDTESKGQSSWFGGPLAVDLKQKPQQYM